MQNNLEGLDEFLYSQTTAGREEKEEEEELEEGQEYPRTRREKEWDDACEAADNAWKER